MIHLRYDLLWFAFDNKEGIKEKHPQEMMKDLGITYERGVPQSLGDQWWFLNCQNVPEELPGYLEKMEFSQEDYEYWTK